MNQQQLREFNKDRYIKQICIVTDDVEKAVREWVEVFQVGPWSITSFSEKTMSDFTVGGQLVKGPFEFKIAISYIGELEVEIIEPISGPNIYSDFLAKKGPGLHHIKEYFATDKIEEEVARYEALGHKVTQTGWFAGQDVHYYVDTDARTGMIMELGNCPEIIRPEGSFTMYPED